tara:strand:+ start:395 stop:1198 length:804 start_codon:yes stop_codon:yes gene_type:complete
MQDKNLNIYKDFISKIKNHLKIYTDDALAKKLKVSPSAVAQWYKRGVPQRFMIEYDQIISGAGEIVQSQGVQVEENQITIEGDKKVNSTVNKISTNDLLQDLDEKRGYIGYLKNEIAQLKSALNRKTIENASFDSQPYDCLFDVSIGFGLRGITRTINSITNIEMFPKMLGYTKQEMEDYWDLGVKHKFANHPIDKIIDKDSREKFKNQSEDLPKKMKDEETIIGDHFYTMQYYYIHKEGHKVPVNVTAKILWWEKRIVCKLNFMND